MLAKFLELNLKHYIKVQEKNKEVVVFVHVLDKKVKLGTFTGCSRVATAKKCTKKRDARAKILFFQSNYKPRVRTRLSTSNSMTFSITF